MTKCLYLNKFKLCFSIRNSNVFFFNFSSFLDPYFFYLYNSSRVILSPYWERQITVEEKTCAQLLVSKKACWSYFLCRSTLISSIGMYILGISAFYHDSAACLVCDGDIISASYDGADRWPARRLRQEPDGRAKRASPAASVAGTTDLACSYLAWNVLGMLPLLARRRQRQGQ